MPPGRVARSAFSNVACWPSASMVDVGAAPSGQPLDLGDRILFAVVDDHVGAEPSRHRQPLGHRVHADDERRAAELRAQRGAQPDRALREHGHGVADPDAAALGAAQAGREDVGHEHDLLVAQPVGNRRQVGARIGNEQVLGPRAVDGVAEAPAAERAAALRVRAVQAVEALAARRDRADDHALADVYRARAPHPARV